MAYSEWAMRDQNPQLFRRKDEVFHPSGAQCGALGVDDDVLAQLIELWPMIAPPLFTGRATNFLTIFRGIQVSWLGPPV
jgi:hypothetical protein